MNTISTKQLVIMIIFLPLLFKLAGLPSLMYATAETSSYITVFIMAIIEFAQLILILFFVNKGGVDGIKEKYHINLVRIIGVPLLLVYFVKLTLCLSETFTYLQFYAFYNVRPEPIVFSFLIIVAYLAFKGVKTLGRLFEIAIWFVPLILILGLAFGKVELKPEYMRMVFDKGLSPIFSGLRKYLVYTLDFTPLLFIKLDNKKRSALKLSVASIFSIMILGGLFMVLVAYSGRATFLVNESFASLASFNTVTSEIGNLEWPAGMLWVTMSLFSMALTIFAVAEIGKAFKIKRQISIGIVCTIIGILSLTLFTKTASVLQYLTEDRQLFLFCIEIAVPIILLILILIKPKEKQSEKS